MTSPRLPYPELKSNRLGFPDSSTPGMSSSRLADSIERKTLEFDIDVLDAVFNRPGRYFVKMTIQSLATKDYSNILLRKWPDEGFARDYEAVTSVVTQRNQENVPELCLFEDKKFTFRLPAGFCKNDRNHDVYLLFEAFYLPSNNKDSGKKMGEGKVAIYPRTNAPRTNHTVNPGEDMYRHTQVVTLLRTSSKTGKAEMHCGRMRCNFALKEYDSEAERRKKKQEEDKKRADEEVARREEEERRRHEDEERRRREDEERREAARRKEEEERTRKEEPKETENPFQIALALWKFSSYVCSNISNADDSFYSSNADDSFYSSNVDDNFYSSHADDSFYSSNANYSFYSSNADDSFYFSNADDSFYSSNADDSFYSSNADDSFYSSNADDSFYSSNADDSFYSSYADDSFYSSNADDSFFSSHADDSFHSSNADDSFYSSNADDNFFFSYADDSFYSTNADDSFYSSNADDSFYSSIADDSFYSSNADDNFYSFHADDSLYCSNADYSFYSSNADDSFYSSNADDSFFSSHADDSFHSSNADDSFYSSNADDSFYFSNADDSFCSSNADDSFYSSNADDSFFSSHADDSFHSSNADDSFYSSNADDSFYFSNADDSFCSSNADDSFYSSNADDSFFSSHADDSFYSSIADDSFYSSNADDNFYSFHADDSLYCSNADYSFYSSNADDSFFSSHADDSFYSSNADYSFYSSNADDSFYSFHADDSFFSFHADDIARTPGPNDKRQPLAPKRGPSPVSEWEDTTSVNLPVTPPLTPPLQELRKTIDSPLRDYDKSTYSANQTWRHTAKPGHEQVEVIVHGSSNLPNAVIGKSVQPYTTIKLRQDMELNHKARGKTHAVDKPTNAPSWEEMVTMELTDQEAEKESMVLTVVDSLTRKELVGYSLPVVNLQPFHQYHMEMVLPARGGREGVKLYASIMRKVSSLPKDPSSPNYLALEFFLRGVQLPLQNPIGPLIAVARIVPDYFNYKSDNLLSNPRAAGVSMSNVTFPNPQKGAFTVVSRSSHGYPQLSLLGKPETQPKWNHPFLFCDEKDKATMFTPTAALVIEYYVANTAMTDEFWRIQSPVGFSSLLLDQKVYQQLSQEKAKMGMRVESVPIMGSELKMSDGRSPLVGMVLKLITTHQPDSMAAMNNLDTLPAMELREGLDMAPHTADVLQIRTPSPDTRPKDEEKADDEVEEPEEEEILAPGMYLQRLNKGRLLLRS
ncbi:coiled-coil domain-containing protein 33 [Biomphalaria pfeifferi]|uniref:Coiled-coil domain-containing protein 33 n=1 Tax=Biomphalaria pfeifferi TaxID=112525 RepID=A0AAD8F979_BIOPF|nr:coiled-coil domain-containing protein 33 [Biomphalaria pfeifferi]